MVEKKVKKSIKTSVSKAEPKTVVAAADSKAFAKDIAANFHVSAFDFLIIKRQNGIDDYTPISVSEFKKMYQKIIEGR